MLKFSNANVFVDRAPVVVEAANNERKRRKSKLHVNWPQTPIGPVFVPCETQLEAVFAAVFQDWRIAHMALGSLLAPSTWRVPRQVWVGSVELTNTFALHLAGVTQLMGLGILKLNGKGYTYMCSARSLPALLVDTVQAHDAPPEAETAVVHFAGLPPNSCDNAILAHILIHGCVKWMRLQQRRAFRRSSFGASLPIELVNRIVQQVTVE